MEYIIKHVHHHACGKIDLVLPHLIDWGLDGIELDAPRMTGFDDLGKFREQLMFWAGIDIQTIYPIGTPLQCQEEVKIMIKNLGTSNGGYGAFFYPTPHHLRVPKANIKAFRHGLKKYGSYRV